MQVTICPSSTSKTRTEAKDLTLSYLLNGTYYDVCSLASANCLETYLACTDVLDFYGVTI